MSPPTPPNLSLAEPCHLAAYSKRTQLSGRAALSHPPVSSPQHEDKEKEEDSDEEAEKEENRVCQLHKVVDR